MSWATENKFLTGFGVVMLAGLGTLGYLAFSAMGKYDEALGALDGASAQLNQLQQTKPALTDANFKEMKSQQAEIGDKIASFQAELRARVLKATPMKSAEFQDALKASVAKVTAAATEAKVGRPKEFYLGFDDYRAKPPDEKAAPLLGRQLRAMELIMDVIVKAGRSGEFELEELKREPLPEEGGKAKTPTPPPTPPGPGRKNAAPEPVVPLVEKARVQLKFKTTDSGLRDVIGGLTNHKDQLFVVRNIAIANTQQDSPPRVAGPGGSVAPDAAPAAAATPDPNAPGAAAVAPVDPTAAPQPPADPAAPAATAPAALQYVFGTEKIVCTLDVDILNIAEPQAKPAAGTRTKPN